MRSLTRRRASQVLKNIDHLANRELVQAPAFSPNAQIGFLGYPLVVQEEMDVTCGALK